MMNDAFAGFCPETRVFGRASEDLGLFESTISVFECCAPGEEFSKRARLGQQPASLHRCIIIVGLLMVVIGASGCSERRISLIYRDIDSSHFELNTNADSDPISNGSIDIRDTDTPCPLDTRRIRITTLDVGQPIVSNEAEATLVPVVLSPIPDGTGSRLAWMGEDAAVHITVLDEQDRVVDTELVISAHDFQDMVATTDGGAILLTRESTGGGILNCGNADHLCVAPEEPVPCFDMYLVKFSATEEQWATRLTSASETVPPYSTAPDGDSATMIWWYAHHGRIATNGHSFAAYFGSALSASTGECINIFQGDRMQMVAADGTLLDGGFGWGCSPSGYQRIVWNATAHAYVAVCKSEIGDDGGMTGVIAFAPDKAIIRSVDPWYANLSELVVAQNGGYWLAVSDRRDGEPPHGVGNAGVHLLHFTSWETLLDISIEDDSGGNLRAPHLAPLGTSSLLLMYERSEVAGNLMDSADRTTVLQVRDAITGDPVGDALTVPTVTGHRYQPLRPYPDGSVAFAVAGATPQTITILRVHPCDPGDDK